jgi:hypothetical protein
VYPPARRFAVLTREQIEAYEKQIDENYAREKDAIRIMRRLVDQNTNGANATVTTPTTAPSFSGSTADDLPLPPLEPNLETPSLFRKIEEVAKAFPNDKWTMRRMLAYLQQIRFPLRESKPEGSISAALGKLARIGKLKILRQGMGSVASIYQWNENWRPEVPEGMEGDKETLELG